MSVFVLLTILIALSALFGYINIRFIRLPNNIGLMLISLVFTLLLIAANQFNVELLQLEKQLVDRIEFEDLVLNIFLGFILFAGGFHTDYTKLKQYRSTILILATLGTCISSLLIGGVLFYVLQLTGMHQDFVHCLLFGILISPTDPIAILGILKKVGVPQHVESKIVGESLFNDGIAVVLFITVFQFAQSDGNGFGPQAVLGLLGKEVVGGVVLGLALGYGCSKIMKSIDDYNVEVFVTLACVMVGTAMAHKLHSSAPLAMATAGLFMGKEGVRTRVMSDVTQKYVDKFWELIDNLINTVLFVLIGMEMLKIEFSWNHFWIAALAIPLVLVSRFVSLWISLVFLGKKEPYLVLTWSGLRGAVSIAMALRLTESMDQGFFLLMTFVVVVFSILVQGTSAGQVARRLLGMDPTPEK